MKTLTHYTQLLNNKFTKKNVIAPVESSSTASQAYTEGKKFFYNNILYQATDDIAEGGLIVPDTNCTPADNIIDNIDNISDEIADMNNVLGAKNLLPNLGLATSTDNGITYTKQSDGSVIANGTASKWAYYNLCTSFTLEAGTYIISGKLAKDGTQIKLLNAHTSADIVIVSNSQTERTFTLANTTNIHAILYVGTAAGAVSNFVFKPMLRLATDTDSTYQPYAMTNQQMTPYVQAISNPNLLDNPWFTVNQRGQSSYTNGMSLDRWHYFTNNSGDLSISNNGIVFPLKSDSQTNLFQRLDSEVLNLLRGKTVTFSIMINDTIYSRTATIPTGSETFNFSYRTTTRNNVNVDFFYQQDGYLTFRVIKWGSEAITDNSITIRAVKLELGSVSTLAMDTAPNYATELLKCQRYFVRFKSGSTYSTYSEMGFVVSTTEVRVPLNLPTNMRTSPTVNTSGAFRIFNATDYSTMSSTITSVTGITFLGSKITLKCVGSGFVTSKMVALAADNDANTYIDFSADL